MRLNLKNQHKIQIGTLILNITRPHFETSVFNKTRRKIKKKSLRGDYGAEAVPPANLQMTSVGKGGLLTIGRLKATMYWECVMLLAIVCIGEANQNCLEDCSHALGMENHTINDSQIFGGSAYNSDYSMYGAQNARLHSSWGYRSDPTVKIKANMIGIDLRKEMVITGIATQGYGDPIVAEWVDSFNVIYKDSFGKRQGVKNTKGNLMDFPGNTDSNSVKRNDFPIPVLASAVYILPLKVHNNIGLRLELYGCISGHYFIVWLMLRKTFFTVEFTDPSSKGFQDAVSVTVNGIDGLLGKTWGFLFARIRQLSPQRSSSYSTLVTAIVEIHCLRSSEQHLLTKLKSLIETKDTAFEPDYLRSQYPNRCGCAPPSVELRLSKNTKEAENIWVSKLLSKSVYVKDSCPARENVIYEWILSRIDQETGSFGPFMLFTRMKRLRLPLKTIGLGDIYVQCTVETLGDDTSLAFDYGYIKVVRPPLVAIITVVRQADGLNSTIELRAEKSFDAELSSNNHVGLNYAWFCRLEEEKFPLSSKSEVADLSLNSSKSHDGCFGSGSSVPSSKDKVLVVNRAEMVKSNKYVFKLVVSKDTRNASAEHELNLAPQASLYIRCLSNCGHKVTLEDDLELEVRCNGDQCGEVKSYTWKLLLVRRTAHTWTASEVINIRVNSSMNGRRAIISDIWKLLDDSVVNIDYTVTAFAEFDYYNVVKANFSFVVNSPPKGFTSGAGCAISPREGEAIFTDFSISCWGWKDEDIPLTYEFRYQSSYGILLIQSGNFQNLSSKLPIGDSSKDFVLELEALVGDTLNAFTRTKLSVKVHPPQQSDFSDKFIDQQINYIRGFVKAKDFDEATELSLVLMSTFKTFDDGTFDENSGKILKEMKDVQVESAVHVTKIAAIVIMATENPNKVLLTSQQSSKILLERATTFLARQFAHQQKLAQNISIILLNGIGGLLRSSSYNARLEMKDVDQQASYRAVSLKMIELTRSIVKSLSALFHKGEGMTVRSKHMHIVMFKGKLGEFRKRNIVVGGASFYFPDFPISVLRESNESVLLELIAFGENPYTWHSTSSIIRSNVIDITLRNSLGKEIKIANLSEPVGLKMPIKEKIVPSIRSKQHGHLFLKPGVIQYHSFVMPTREHLVNLRVKTLAGQPLAIYSGHGFKPSTTNYTSVTTLPDFSSCQNNKFDQSFNCTMDPNVVTLFNNGPGLYFVGITFADSKKIPLARIRRSCNDLKKRKKRSCLRVKDPPTNPPPAPKIITPHYDPLTDVNYTYSLTMTTCLYWSEVEDKWSSRGCKLGPDAVPSKVHCLCNHLTSFGGDFLVAPNKIDFEKVWTEFGRLGESRNYAVLATVFSMLGFYLVCLLFARRADKRDELKVIAGHRLMDNNKDGYSYSISIQTGVWRNSGTTASVGMILYGMEDISNEIMFEGSVPHRIFFARGSVNTFKVTLERSLGSLFKVHVWHDNFGDSPSWFLVEIVVEDVQTNEKWYFMANRWLAVERGDGKIDTELKAASLNERSEFKNVFQSRAQIAVGDSHLWISLFTKPPHNPFTRCQRLSCCMSIVFSAMVTGAMFYRFGAKSTDGFHIGPLSISWTEIKIGVQSAILAIPVNLVIVTTFKNCKLNENQNSTCMTKFYRYFGWGLCLSVILTSAVFTVFYSLSWGAQTSNQWLVSMTFSITEDVVLIQPVKLLFVVCFVSVMTRKPPEIPNPISSLHPNKHLMEIVGKGCKMVKKLQFEELKMARFQRIKEIKTIRALIELISFLLFIVLLMVVCYGNRDSARFTLTTSVKDLFGHFSKVNDTASFWGWMKETFVPGMYNTSWYNGRSFEYDEGFIGNRENFLVGMPRLRQVRIRPDRNCGMTYEGRILGIPRCLPFYSDALQERNFYNIPGWIPKHNGSAMPGIESLCPKPWQYQTAEELKTEQVRGKMALYGGGGYVANIGYNTDSALKVLGYLEKEHWIDDKTAAVLVECTVFEPSTYLFCVLNYLYERNPMGDVYTSAKIKTMTLYLPQGSKNDQLFYQVCQVLLTLVIVAFATNEIVKALREPRAYFKRLWSWVEIMLLSFASSAVYIMVSKDKFTREYVTNVRSNPFDNFSADEIVAYSEIEDYLLACVMLLITVKSLRLTRFNPHIFRMQKTLRLSFSSLCSYSVVFGVVVFSFSSFGSIAFGSSVVEYSSLIDAILSLLKMLIGGKSSYYKLKVTSESFLGPVFLFVYLVIAVFLLVNVFIAILDNYYTASKETSRKDMDRVTYAEILLYAWTCFKALMYYLYSFRLFSKDAFKQSGESHSMRSLNRVQVEDCAPRLASIESLEDITIGLSTTNTMIYKEADAKISKVEIQLAKLFNECAQKESVVDDIVQEIIIDSDTECESDSSFSDSELHLRDECDGFLEGFLLHSSHSSIPSFWSNERFYEVN